MFCTISLQNLFSSCLEYISFILKKYLWILKITKRLKLAFLLPNGYLNTLKLKSTLSVSKILFLFWLSSLSGCLGIWFQSNWKHKLIIISRLSIFKNFFFIKRFYSSHNKHPLFSAVKIKLLRLKLCFINAEKKFDMRSKVKRTNDCHYISKVNFSTPVVFHTKYLAARLSVKAR